MKSKMTPRGKQILYRTLTAVFGIGFIVAVLLIFRNTLVEKRAKDIYDSMASMANSTETESSEAAESASSEPEDTETESSEQAPTDELAQLGITVPQKNLNWNEMWEQNQDIYAWLYLPNTNVDYPVLQHPTDDSYYVTHNLDGSGPRPGCIFSDRSNNKQFTDFATVLYGHNMHSNTIYKGTMFNTLHYYGDEEFFKNDDNRYIYIYRTDGVVLVYDIFAAVEFHDAMLSVWYDFASEAGRKAYLDEVMAVKAKKSYIREGVEVTPDDHILVLSTCITNKDNKRYLVQGVLVNKSALETPAE